MPKIYVYPRGEASHPLNPQIKTQVAQAIDEEGNELAEFYGKDEKELQAQVQHHTWEGKNNRLIWVDNPDDHPIIPRLVAQRMEREAIADIEERAGLSQWKPDELELIREQSHICAACKHMEVCAVATAPVFNAQKVTVSACLSYLPRTSDDDESQHEIRMDTEQ